MSEHEKARERLIAVANGLNDGFDPMRGRAFAFALDAYLHAMHSACLPFDTAVAALAAPSEAEPPTWRIVPSPAGHSEEWVAGWNAAWALVKAGTPMPQVVTTYTGTTLPPAAEAQESSEALGDRAAALVCEIACCGVEHHDRRDGYATIQIDSDLWDEVQAFKAACSALDHYANPKGGDPPDNDSCTPVVAATTPGPVAGAPGRVEEGRTS